MESIEFIIRAATRKAFHVWLKEHPVHVYTIWHPGKIPQHDIEEYYGGFNPEWLHPDDKAKYDENTKALQALLDEENPVRQVPSAVATALRNPLLNSTNTKSKGQGDTP